MSGQANSIELRGLDGSSWALGGPSFTRQDAYILGGMTGLFVRAPRTSTRTSRARQIGSTHRMTKIEERLVDCRVRLEGRTRRDLEELRVAFESAWSTDADSTIVTHSELYGDRTIKMRLDREMRPDFTNWSMQSTKEELECVFVACWPYFTSGTDTLKYNFPAGNSTYTFELSNDTDVPLWVEWGGDAGTFQVPDGLSGRMVPIPKQVGVWKVRTRQELETLSSVADYDEWKKMRGVSFLYEIAPRTLNVKLPVVVTAAPAPGQLRLIARRNHEMPWG